MWHSVHKGIQQIRPLRPCQRNDSARMYKGVGWCQGFAEQRSGGMFTPRKLGPPKVGRINRGYLPKNGKAELQKGDWK